MPAGAEGQYPSIYAQSRHSYSSSKNQKGKGFRKSERNSLDFVVQE